MRNIGRRSLLISVVLLGAVFAIHGTDPGAAQTEIQLFRGFNEIVWSQGSVEVADGLASIGGRYTAVFRWNNAGQRWDTFAPQLPSALQGFSQLERGRAYWIAMTESGTLVPRVEGLTRNGAGDVAQLAALTVRAEQPRTGYDRSLFRHWVDADGDGCDTRREVLIAEAVTAPTIGAGCALSGGRWRSVYDNATETGSGRGFDVDHLVPLAEAWESGAWAWSRDDRERYANDLGYDHALVAVSARSNRAKGARDPAEWLPPDESAHCWYAAAWNHGQSPLGSDGGFGRGRHVAKPDRRLRRRPGRASAGGSPGRRTAPGVHAVPSRLRSLPALPVRRRPSTAVISPKPKSRCACASSV